MQLSPALTGAENDGKPCVNRASQMEHPPSPLGKRLFPERLRLRSPQERDDDGRGLDSDAAYYRVSPCKPPKTAQESARERAVSGIGVSVNAEDLDVNEQNIAVPA